MKRHLLLGTTSLLACLAAVASLPVSAADVTHERLLNADREAANWLMVHRTFDAHRYSPNDQITRDNVQNLRIAFFLSFDVTQGLGRYPNVRNQNTPLVEDGFMYAQPGWSKIYKIDVRDGKWGKIVWKVDPQVDRQWVVDATCCGNENRGMGMDGNNLIALTLDGRVMSINKDTGEVNWEKQRAIKDRAESFTVAPLMVKGNAIYGPAGGEYGIRGWVEALNAKTGAEVWKHYNIPAPGEPGNDTWKAARTWETGGASIWQTGSYDPETDLTYWGTGNPAPQIDAEYRPGDNLYASSLLALNATTGKMAWYFQFTPNDPYDYDEVGEAQVYDTTINGQRQKMVVRIARNGFVYGFNPANGQFIYGKQYTDDMTWTTGLDPKTGRPLNYDPAGGLQKYAAGTVGSRDKEVGIYCPSLSGGKNWQPASLSAKTQLLYVATTEGCSAYIPTVAPNPTITGGQYDVVKAQREWNGRLPAPADTKLPAIQTASVKALDPKTGAVVAKYPMVFRGNGMLATGGGLVFTSDRGGVLYAFDDRDLKLVWSQNLGTSLTSPPISYLANGKQYIAVLTGHVPANQHLEKDPALKHFVSVDGMFVLSVN
jgi:alcohol dehydrogenase (cytochrome c)